MRNLDKGKIIKQLTHKEYLFELESGVQIPVSLMPSQIYRYFRLTIGDTVEFCYTDETKTKGKLFSRPSIRR